jgi:ribonuclease BN (tRNA processing enzyme)
VVVDDRAYLVDCGPGVVRRAAAAAERGVEALRADRLHHLFLTHLHSDHTVGLPDVVFTPWTLEREAPLAVFGPPGTRAMVDHVRAAWADDVRIRVDGLEPANETGHEVVVREFAPGVVHEDELVRVVAFRVPHGSIEHAYGFRFETPDRVVVISGDTGPSEEVARQSEGADVLVHEVYSQAGFAAKPPEWKRYHAAFHTSTAELAELAARAKPGLLVLTHQLFWGSTEAELLREIREAGYEGRVVSGRDLDVH